jgi:peptidoglycan/LPS O-acetylase OafA/YrhL
MMTARQAHSARIPSLDGLRAVAIGMVLFGHSIEMHPPLYLKWIGAYAEFGVRIFFVLSGFLITTLLLEELAVTGRISLKKFYLRRVFRIFPASYTYIVAISLLSAFGVIALHAHDLLHAVTYTANYEPNRSWYIGHL